MRGVQNTQNTQIILDSAEGDDVPSQETGGDSKVSLSLLSGSEGFERLDYFLMDNSRRLSFYI